jgi:hypothetical protein
MLMSCRSASSPSSWKIFSIRPLHFGRSRRCRSAPPWVPASGVPYRPSAALGNRASDAPIRRLSVRTVELSASCRSPHRLYSTLPLQNPFGFIGLTEYFLSFCLDLCFWKHTLGMMVQILRICFDSMETVEGSTPHVLLKEIPHNRVVQ